MCHMPGNSMRQKLLAFKKENIKILWPPRFEDMPSFFIHHSSQDVYRFVSWQYSWNMPYAIRSLSSKAYLPNTLSFANQTMQDAARSAPKPIWKVCTKSGFIRLGTQPATFWNTFPTSLNGDGPGLPPGPIQGASGSKRHHSFRGALMSYWMLMDMIGRGNDLTYTCVHTCAVCVSCEEHKWHFLRDVKPLSRLNASNIKAVQKFSWNPGNLLDMFG